MLITKEQVLAAFAAMGMAMTMASGDALANGEGDDVAQFGSTSMGIDRSAEANAPATAQPANTGVSFDRSNPAAPRPHATHPFERVVIQTGDRERPDHNLSVSRRTSRPIFRACVLTPRQLINPFLILPNVSPLCPR